MKKAFNSPERKSQLARTYHVVIVGRPNVGKSTLFNRLIGRKRALVHDMPGVTRDRIEEITLWDVPDLNRRPALMSVLLTDTGGMGGELFAQEIKEQVHLALHSADLVLFVLDSQAGLTPADEDLYQELQRSGVIQKIPVIGIVNKVDAEQHETRINDFYSLGLDPLITVSSEHGRGFDDLKEIAAAQVGFAEALAESRDNPAHSSEPLSEEDSSDDADGDDHSEGDALEDSSADANSDGAEAAEEDAIESPAESPAPRRIPRIAIVGRPNVGKSTLLNALLGEKRMITSPIAGTTVDSIDVTIELEGKPFIVVDTAGIRRKNKTEQGIEVLSVVQARKALERADLAILVLDGETGTYDQDEKIGGLIEEAGCSVILALNKWDTQRGNQGFSRDDAAKQIRERMAYLKYAPIIFTSALRRQGLNGLGELIEEVLHQRQLKIPTHEFTEWLRKESTVHNPMNAKFFLCHQTSRRPPTFMCHVNDPEKIDFSLKRHLVNAMREKWGYMGSPVRLLFAKGKSDRPPPRKKS